MKICGIFMEINLFRLALTTLHKIECMFMQYNVIFLQEFLAL